MDFHSPYRHVLTEAMGPIPMVRPQRGYAIVDLSESICFSIPRESSEEGQDQHRYSQIGSHRMGISCGRRLAFSTWDIRRLDM